MVDCHPVVSRLLELGRTPSSSCRSDGQRVTRAIAHCEPESRADHPLMVFLYYFAWFAVEQGQIFQAFMQAHIVTSCQLGPSAHLRHVYSMS